MIRKIRNEKKVTRINAGGPGSGRYPAGSGGKDGDQVVGKVVASYDATKPDPQAAKDYDRLNELRQIISTGKGTEEHSKEIDQIFQRQSDRREAQGKTSASRSEEKFRSGKTGSFRTSKK